LNWSTHGSTPKGVTIQVYRPAGRPQYETATPDPSTDVGDALDDRRVPAVWPRPTHVGNEKYVADFSIIEASGLDVALKLATEGSKACNRNVDARRDAAKAAGRAYGRRRCPAMASTSRIVHNRRSRKSLKDIREAVSDRGRGVRSRGERPPARGAPNHRR
jgi:hypothetical protein